MKSLTYDCKINFLKLKHFKIILICKHYLIHYMFKKTLYTIKTDQNE